MIKTYIIRIVLSVGILFSFLYESSSQATIGELIKEIDFQEDTVRATYDWLAMNIQYDSKKLLRNKKQGKNTRAPKSDAEKIKATLKRKKGVCEDYALLFKKILDEFGYKSHIVVGYVRTLGARKFRNGTHAWNAVEVNGEWKLYDPTWAAGYVNDNKFTKRYNPEWYDISPDSMILTHMPFDPIWQLKTKPVSYPGFDKGNYTKSDYTLKNYETLINEYLSANEFEKAKLLAKRMNQQGRKNIMVTNHLKYLDKVAAIKGSVDEQIVLMGALQKARIAHDRIKELKKGALLRFKVPPFDDESHFKGYTEETLEIIQESRDLYESKKGTKNKKQRQVIKDNLSLLNEYQDLVELFQKKYKSAVLSK